MTRFDRATRKRLARWLLPLGIVFTLLAVAGAWQLFEPAVAIKSLYATLGLLVAMAFYYLPKSTAKPSPLAETAVQSWRYTKVVVSLSILGTATVALGLGRLPVLLTVLPAGALLLGLQLRDDPDPRFVLPQVAALFALSPATKYLATGFYFGDGDIFDHVRGVELLLETGTSSVIPRYDAFPGLHVLSGSVAQLTGLAPYDVFQLLGLVTFTLLLVPMYLAARQLTDSPRMGAFVTAGFATTYVVSLYPNIYFPESLGFVLVGLLLYLSVRVTDTRGSVRLALLSIAVLVGVALVLTHHLTLVLFGPWLALILGTSLVLDRGRLTAPRAIPMVLPWVLGAAYWVFERDFLRELYYFMLVILLGSLSAADQWRSVYALGRDLPELTLEASLLSLFSPEGLYYVTLVAILGLAVVALFVRYERYRPYIHLVVAGLAASVLILRSPILPDFERVRLPASLVFAFPAGIGLAWLFGRVPRNRIARVAPIALFAILLTTAPMVAATDDLYSFHAGSDLYELQPLPEPEVELSDEEFATLRATSQHLQRTGGDVSTMTMTGRAMTMFGISGYSSAPIRNDTFDPDRRLFVSRTTWADHRVAFSPGGAFVSTLTVSDQWLDEFDQRQTKVYTTGNVRIAWNETWGQTP